MVVFLSRLPGWNPFCYDGYLISSYILFLLIFVANVVIMVLMLLLLRGCGVFMLAGSLSSWLAYICYDDYCSDVL
jgi:hypothetical protein